MNKDAISSGDSDDLEALFDSIVQANASANFEPAAAPAAPAPAPVAAAPAPAPAPAPAAPARPAPVVAAVVEEKPVAAEDLPEPAQSMYTKVGQLTRQLHDALRALGYDQALEKAASAIPDAKDRLTYIASMTEQAANRALNAVDTAKPLQDVLESDALRLGDQWTKLYNKQLSVDDFKILAQQTREYLLQVPSRTRATNEQLLEIMMAQDFQDLTGQVIRKIVAMAENMESNLYSFLIEFSPQNKKAGIVIEQAPVAIKPLEEGPVINADGRSDVVTSQQQVDDLLAQLGF